VTAPITITADDMRLLAAAPLADPMRINLPLGKRPARCSGKPVYEGQIGVEKLTAKQVKERRVNRVSYRLVAALDHYATTDVPFDRIAVHLAMEPDAVAEAMTKRGRAA